ncbi:4Fe-4S binding protein [Pseudorhodoplanes sp.]|uniref:4Fe-4S binding protein n=1 Tax=Pseudorhodoplanes sp. TaxID=1934341 RepID=UPI00391DA308
MPLDVDTIGKACRSADMVSGRQFCRSELDRFRALLQESGDLIVGCTQESPVFEEAAGETGERPLTFVNIREAAGWSNEAAKAGPKMAALLAAAAEPLPDIPFVGLQSDGVILIYGRDEAAIEAAEHLKDHLDVTVLITRPDRLAPQRKTEFPVVQGTIRAAKGWLGAFELTVDDYAQPAPSSRDTLRFGTPRNGAVSKCDIVLDLSGGASLLPAGDLRDGYLRADPGDPAAILRAVMKARDLTGTFDKPRYINYQADICAHARSRIVGCRRCLDLCPTGAIEPAGDHVAISAEICAGCGQCAAACPTGAASYALPPADTLMRKLRTILTVYREAGGRNAAILFHDESHGIEMIDALARYGDGLPADVIPVVVNEITQIGLEAIAAAFAYGAGDVRFLLRARPRHDVTGLNRTIALAEPILSGLGYGAGRIAAIETDDPDQLGEALRALAPAPARPAPASFRPAGAKRDVQRLALRELHRVAPQPVEVIALPQGAPFGAVDVKAEGCTLCLACVSACPTGAMSADPDRPMLKFTEDACVQCGLCAATCPEKVIALKPQLDFRAATASPRIMKQEDPFECIRCGKPFGVKSTIERVTAKLEGKHWMFKGQADRLNVLKMCEDCRVVAVTEQAFDPYGGGISERPRPRTTDDYLREEEKGRG